MPTDTQLFRIACHFVTICSGRLWAQVRHIVDSHFNVCCFLFPYVHVRVQQEKQTAKDPRQSIITRGVMDNWDTEPRPLPMKQQPKTTRCTATSSANIKYTVVEDDANSQQEIKTKTKAKIKVLEPT